MFQDNLLKGHQYSCYFLRKLRKKLRRVCLRLRWLIRKRPRLRIVVKRLRKFKPNGHFDVRLRNSMPERPIRIATFNVAMFSLAPAIPIGNDNKSGFLDHEAEGEEEAGSYRLKSILKQSPLNPGAENGIRRPERSKMKVSINLPDNEISLANRKFLGFVESEQKGSPILFIRNGDNNNNRTKVPVRSPICFPYTMMNNFMKYTNDEDEDENDLLMMGSSRRKSIFEVLREVNADILGLQDVKAEEEKGMRPLSDLARALGMHYVFAESWAPEYGNAILSRWPIKRWRAQKIADDDDFRNVLKATIEVPWAGELNFSCTQLDHLDEYWRMRQVRAIVQSYDPPHILAGGLNSLDESDYSVERWMDIVRYYEDIGKPTPKAEVMKFMNLKQYIDAKHFAGDCEPVVIIAKGQTLSIRSKGLRVFRGKSGRKCELICVVSTGKEVEGRCIGNRLLSTSIGACGSSSGNSLYWLTRCHGSSSNILRSSSKLAVVFSIGMRNSAPFGFGDGLLFTGSHVA
ncbi:hypothetical protein CRG98_010867 [Punica granatum]|uniref:Endonuclease/exonuclease/phosphatase domain-containing protein n=1 Tax=Punica granatum TaxID=22663 RepID=A0A2I0KKG8_PUNGR|nr:hypothetical protein CRG98_010867 [Punica granatum]